MLANIFNSAHAQKYWGAVYINKQVGITGASWNWHNKQSAMNEAKKHCMKNSKGKSGEYEIAGGGALLMVVFRFIGHLQLKIMVGVLMVCIHKMLKLGQLKHADREARMVVKK